MASFPPDVHGDNLLLEGESQLFSINLDSVDLPMSHPEGLKDYGRKVRSSKNGCSTVEEMSFLKSRSHLWPLFQIYN